MSRALVLAWFVIAPLLSVTSSAEEPPADVVALVGRLVSIKELPNPCAGDGTPTCVSLDELYEAKYQVVDVLSGVAGGPEISFRIADHYGFPRFAHYRNALLFVARESDGNYLEKYQGYAVHRTTNGSWATCGDAYSADERPHGLRTIAFAEDLGIAGDFSEEGIKERFPDTKYLDVSNGRIRCRLGIPVTDLYERVRTGVLAARGLQLPPLDR